jgi:hypothetical protein
MRFVLPLAATVLTAQAGWANPALGLPLTRKAPVSYRIETRAAHPDYTFILVRGADRHNETTGKREFVLEAEYVELTPDRPLVVHPGPDGASLLIVPRVDTAQHPSPRQLLKDRPDLARQAVYQEFGPYEEVPSWFGDEITITYRVQAAGSGEKLEVVRTSWHPLWQWFAAAIGFVVGVLLLGLWLARRTLRPRATATAN